MLAVCACLALGADRFPAAFSVGAEVGNEAPTQRIKRQLAHFVVAPDYQQLLARRAVPARRVVVEAAVAHVRALDNRVTKRRAALDDPPAHAAYVVARYERSTARRFRSASAQ